jgi:signal peptidase I
MMQKIRTFITWWNRPNKGVVADYAQTLVWLLPLAFVIRTWGYGLYRVPTGSMETTMLVGEMFFADKFTYSFRKPKRGEIITFNEPVYQYSKNKVMNVIEHYIWGPENWTKRVIGIPGDHVEGKIEDGKPVVYLNGNKLDEPYLNNYPLVPVDIHTLTFRSYDPNCSYQDQPFYQMDGMLVKRNQRILAEHGYVAERNPGTPVDGKMPGSNMTDIYDVTLGENQYWAMGDNRLGSWDSRGWGPLDGRLIHGKIAFRIFSLDTSASWLILDLIMNPISFWTRVRWSRFLQTVS